MYQAQGHGPAPRSDTVAALGLTQVLHTPGRLLISCRFPGSLSLCWGPVASPWRSNLVLHAAMHLPSCPRTLPLALAWEAEVNRLSPEPRRPFDYISRCKQAGRGRATGPPSPGAGGGAPFAPLKSVSFPPSSLHQPFAASSGPGSSWEAGALWQWGVAPGWHLEPRGNPWSWWSGCQVGPLAAPEAVIKICKCTGLPSWQYCHTSDLNVPNNPGGEASKSDPISQKGK